VLVMAAVGCRQDMHDQAKYEPLEASELFDNGAASRVPPANTVARGRLAYSDLFLTGLTAGDQWTATLPMALDEALLARGEQRFNIYCSPCHDRIGSGRGMIVQRGFLQPPSYHEERLREMPIGYFFDVISNGYGQMSGYRAQIKPRDRWAIAAWIRVLQRSQNATAAGLSADELANVEAGKDERPAPAAGHGDDHGAESGADHDGAAEGAAHGQEAAH
jgi:mono/diheme cytochrome c family protein